jgi:hypothetical protein
MYDVPIVIQVHNHAIPRGHAQRAQLVQYEAGDLHEILRRDHRHRLGADAPDGGFDLRLAGALLFLL